ncbi:MAG: ADP-ribosylglycohydrolase family protein [Siphonobacter aquaeclarae]|nr:ADP-ribosylglycohydrolase family protein [Siphonobacter aquaeclarae]
MTPTQIQGFLLGTAVGDAMGVPVEFTTRKFLKEKPVSGMRGYGTHHQPPGTWSDDSALTYQTTESLIGGQIDYAGLAQRFLNWYLYAHWTANGTVFDVGIATRNALDRLEQGVEPILAGETHELCNGNGSLMRILPLAFYFRSVHGAGFSQAERFQLVRNVSSITHGHIRSAIACFILVEFAGLLLDGLSKEAAFAGIQSGLPAFLESQAPADELELFHRILAEDLASFPESDIYSSGYVLHSLEASLWSLLTTSSFQEALLRGVNLAGDADTTGSVTGGLAGLYYGTDGIPAEWLAPLARKEDIQQLSDRFTASLLPPANGAPFN